MVARITQSLVVRLAQLGQSHMGKYYLPYSAGLLQAYVEKHAPNPSRYTFLPPFYKRQRLAYMLKELAYVDILGLSHYVWNAQFELALAEAFKARYPNRLVVMGGPQVPDRAEAFLRQYPFIDIVVHGEGERVFLKILEAADTRDWSEIPGVSYLKDGAFFTAPKPPRMQDINEVPSPYLSGLFLPLMESDLWGEWIVPWETNRGCPFSCSFCDWGSAVQSKVYAFELERLKAELDWFAAHRIEHVFCCDANYGILKRDLELTEYVVALKARTQLPKSMIIQNTKNLTDRAYTIQKMLYAAGLNQTATVSLQSMNPEALKAIRRDNIKMDSYRTLLQRFNRDQMQAYTDILIGLPGDTYETYAEGLGQLFEEGQHHMVKFHETQLLPNAEMAAPEYRQRYQLETVHVPYVFTLEVDGKPMDGVMEYQEIIVAHQDMPREDWCRMRVLSWWASLLFYSCRVSRIAMVLLYTQCQISFRKLVESFTLAPYIEGSLLADIHGFFVNKAQQVLQGDSPYCHGQLLPGTPHLPIWMEANDHILSGLIQTQSMGAFYQAQQRVFERLMAESGTSLPAGALDAALRLNQAILVSQHASEPLEISLPWNVWDVYVAHSQGESVRLKPGHFEYIRDWQGTPFFYVKSKSELGVRG